MPDEVDRNIAALPQLLSSLSPDDRRRFERIFQVDVSTSTFRAPAAMHAWMMEHFGSEESVQSQTVVKVTNLITLEGALYNKLRARRPMDSRVAVDLADRIAAKLGDTFCRPLECTPEDLFGRVWGKHCVTASNLAKADGYHGLVIFDEHNPLTFDSEMVKDYIDTGLAWARLAHCEDREACNFLFLWNCLWRSGSSIVHGHAQVLLGKGIHYAPVEHLRRAALLYRIGHGVSYFDDLCKVHTSLGLVQNYRRIRVLSYLTPAKEKEVLLIAPRLDDDLKLAIFRVLRCLLDRLSVCSFNLAIYMKPIDSSQQGWQGFPVVVRIVDRGDVNTETSDIGAMELYGAPVISSDPFEVARALASSFAD